MGYSKVICTETDKESALWEATLAGSHLPNCHLVVDAKATRDKFSVTVDDRTLANQDSVFSITDPNFDVRVPVLVKLYASFSDKQPDWYRAAILLWQSIERSK
jgi:hypothetical protein